jgi:hypothetical protein
MGAHGDKTFLILTQVYTPDPAAVGQHIADAAAELARRGRRVRVITSARGYEDPSKVYPRREMLNGVDVVRVPLSSFGKSSIAIRLLAQWLFVLQAILRGLFTRNLAGILVSTSPPFCGFAGAVLSRVRGVPVKYWLMDLNPDQMIAMGKAKKGSAPVRVFEMFNRMILRQSSDIVMLDRFMLDRVRQKSVPVDGKTTVIPPWPHETTVHSIPHDQNPFRAKHDLGGKFVVMYSGNHSPANPLKTLLDGAEQLQDDDRIVFMFIGGGSGKKEVEDRIAKGVRNIRSLPYQPLDQLKFSLSAADLHVVSLGDDVVGIVHPCKVYGAMCVSRPILLLGPDPSHVSDLINQHQIGWQVRHGDVAGIVRSIRTAAAMPPTELARMGAVAGAVVASGLSRPALAGRFCDVLERGLDPSPRPAAAGNEQPLRLG